MKRLNVLCVDDQREVLAVLRKDLDVFSEVCRITDCESAAEALEVMEALDARGERVALIICDHVMPGKNGIEFLIDVHHDDRFTHTRKLLITGLATHQDTIVAINEADIDRYIEKPWDLSLLHQSVKALVTRFVLDEGIDYQPYLRFLDHDTLFRELRKRG